MTTVTPPYKPRTHPAADELTVAQAVACLNVSRARVGQRLVAKALPGARKVHPLRGHSFWVIPRAVVAAWRTERIEAGFTVGPAVPERKANVL